ncbi:MAG: hypothetical protein Q8M11_10630 [Sulfuritalea sp.]|jgi:uncharacterized protein YggT (Ycf19 family)|nr:hypothetical protein [Sulfuritalea sp.]MDP1985133.1 hypothetical protein [Sulfuritalea sp.]
MSHPELLFLGVLRALVEVAMLFLLGQGLLALLAGNRRHNNTMYKLFLIITGPVLKIVRRITPPQIIEKHLPFVAFALLFWCWIALAWLKKLYCDNNMLQCF